MELMAETAATAHPDLEVVEVSDVRLHHGITIDGPSVVVRVLATAVAPAARRAAPRWK